MGAPLGCRPTRQAELEPPSALLSNLIPHGDAETRDRETQRDLCESAALGQGRQGKAGPLAGSALKSRAPRSQRGMGVEGEVPLVPA